MTTDAPVLVGGVPITRVMEVDDLLAGMIWGPAGCGKTTLACTAPGRKLLLNFDPRGPASVAYRTDVDVADLSAAAPTIIDQVRTDDPFKLSGALDGYDTLVIDSLTNFGHLALRRGIEIENSGRAGGTPATFEKPGKGGYGVRLALMIQLTKNVLALCKRKNKHVFFIAHEGSAETDDKGTVLSVTIALGGQMPNQVALDLSEVWYMHDGGKEDRRITIRPARLRKPMKTRMFSTTGDVEFKWKYNSDTGEGPGIEDWYKAWLAGGKKKLPLPT